MILQSLSLFFASLLIFPTFGQQIGDFIYSSDISSPKTSSLSPLGYDIYIIQTQIADKVISGSISLIQEDALSILASIRDISSYQLVSAMRNSSDKSKILDIYISSLKKLFYQTNSIQHQIKSETSLLSAEIASCAKQKGLYDNQYVTALEDAAPISSLESLVLLSQSSASCVSSKQILLNSKQSLSNLLSAEIAPLGEKYQYLVVNRDAIMQYFDLLDAGYLQKVIDLQDTLKHY